MSLVRPEIVREMDALEMKPKAALVVSTNAAQEALVTMHSCFGGSTPRIGVGKPVTPTILQRLLDTLKSDDTNTDAGLYASVPENLLAQGANGKVWFVKSAVRKMWFIINGKQSIKTVAWPNLIFVGNGNALYVFSYKGNKRPNLDTALHYAPLMNIYERGNLCWGNIAPPALDGGYMANCEKAIFESWFSHENHDFTVAGKCGRNLAELYQQLEKSGAKQFPSRKLRSMGISLGEFLRGMV